MLIQVNGNNHSMSLNYTVSVLQHGPPILDLIKGAFARSILLLTLVNSLRLSSYLEFRPLLVKIINLLFDFISSIMPLKNIISTRLATKCIWLVSVSCSGSSIWQWFTCKLQIKMFWPTHHYLSSAHHCHTLLWSEAHDWQFQSAKWKQTQWANTPRSTLENHQKEVAWRHSQKKSVHPQKDFIPTAETPVDSYFNALTINAWCFFDKFWAPVKSRPVLVDEAMGSFSLIHASSSSTSWRNLLSLSASWSLAFRARRGA